MRRLFVGPVTAATVVASLMLGGCSLYRVHAPTHPGVTDHTATVWSFAWGLAPGQPEVDCRGQAIAEVTVRSNLGYDLLAVATLGLVAPKTIEWTCAGATPSAGTIESGTIDSMTFEKEGASTVETMDFEDGEIEVETDDESSDGDGR